MDCEYLQYYDDYIEYLDMLENDNDIAFGYSILSINLATYGGIVISGRSLLLLQESR